LHKKQFRYETRRAECELLGSARGSRAVFGGLAEHPKVHHWSQDTEPLARPPAAAREATCPPRKFLATHSFDDSNFSADAAAFHVAVVHRLREHGRHDELSTVARFDLIIDLERIRRHGDKEHRAILADLDVIDAIHWGCPRARRGVSNFESARQKI